MIHGLISASILASIGYFLSSLAIFKSMAIGSLTIALLLGIIIANLPYTNTILAKSSTGLQFAQSRILRIGVALFGFNLTWQNVLELGTKAFWLDIGVVSSILILGYFVGTRLLKIDKQTAILTSAGSAICGAAAVMATQDIIKAKQSSTSMAVATVVSFGTLSMLLYPVIYRFGFMPETPFGIYIGATVHEVAQVVAAAETISPQALSVAVIVKLTRVFLLLPFLMILSYLWRKDVSQTGRKLQVPLFLFGFLACLTLNSIVEQFNIEIARTIIEIMRYLAVILLAIAMAALGLNTRLSTWRSLGMQPFLLALFLFILLSVGGFFSVYALYM